MIDDRRLSKDEYFAVLAKIAGARSICRRHKIGTVIVKDGHIISTGYNGPPRGYTHQFCDPCIKDQEKLASNQGHSLCPATHSEANAIVQAAYQGISTKGGVMYTTLFPCDLCQRLIINAGIVELVLPVRLPGPAQHAGGGGHDRPPGRPSDRLQFRRVGEIAGESVNG